MAASKLSLAIFILSLLFLSPFSSACVPCNPAPPKLTPMPPAKVPPVNPFCPRDTLKLGACVDLLGGVVNLVVGSPVSSKCCALLEGLADLEVAACLCTAIKANVLGINLNVPVTLSLLVSACEKSIPPGFQCR
ncbi:PEARLI1-like lipid transfer protein [Actinidia chinensis var. chinensis]|uniref:PEARLI1-like lipid transfer protein n=1 Tax=Actinidia chinensis var. chinensis TaxID=1590841 RepID=A0A2R6PJ74_ACTCC|nr:14 kDa proline-rich protein DC2.15-like [Actinidia eriantha]PSR91843.1 PEARLI1-like lipid transfer protein [Actinidia chinensis var. chinensis]